MAFLIIDYFYHRPQHHSTSAFHSPDSMFKIICLQVYQMLDTKNWNIFLWSEASALPFCSHNLSYDYRSSLIHTYHYSLIILKYSFILSLYFFNSSPIQLSLHDVLLQPPFPTSNISLLFFLDILKSGYFVMFSLQWNLNYQEQQLRKSEPLQTYIQNQLLMTDFSLTKVFLPICMLLFQPF